MIDPKFNELPLEDDFEPVELTAEEREAKLRATPARGLSINDTIARHANLSVGATGVDTSGVAAGAGAGAGSTTLTPAVEDSAAPQIVPAGRGTGSTPLSDATSGQTSTDRTKR